MEGSEGDSDAVLEGQCSQSIKARHVPVLLALAGWSRSSYKGCLFELLAQGRRAANLSGGGNESEACRGFAHGQTNGLVTGGLLQGRVVANSLVVRMVLFLPTWVSHVFLCYGCGFVSFAAGWNRVAGSVMSVLLTT